MLNDILPQSLVAPISLLAYKDLCEIRLRLNRPITVNYKNSFYYLGEGGLCNERNAIVCTKDMLQTALSKASNFSIYSINEEIKQGFITAIGGIRIGVVGDVVFENEKILTIKNFSSINIRIPHQVNGCAYNVAKFVFDENGRVINTLIIGSPSTGKTTILRDLCNQIYAQKKDCNILLLDERMEIASCLNGVPQLSVGGATDVISGGEKSQNIINGLRSMAPDLIVIDEIGSPNDVMAVEYAMNCGVSIVATLHCKNISELIKKDALKNLLANKSFGRIVELSNSKGKGTVENVYDETYRPLLRFLWLRLHC